MKAKHPYGIPPFKSPDSWAVKSKVSSVVKGEGENKRHIGIRVETNKGVITVPTVAGPLAESFIKANNIQRGSLFIRPSFSVIGYSYNAPKR